MNTPLRLLLIEDSEDDEVLLLRELKRGGYEVEHTRVETAEALEQALDAGPWDLVMTDYALPRFDGMSAFAQVQRRGLDVPFLIVSGQIGEDIAVAAMRAGVHDFLLKDRLGRLGPAVARELREARVRAERRRMQEQLLLSDRLASLGMMAASVAHEINNPLASLVADMEYALKGGGAEREGALRDALACAERIQEIVRDIKVFSRPEEGRLQAVEVHRVRDSSLRMARNPVQHRARLVKDYGPVPRVKASEARLGQVFLNLVVNAAQAIPEGHFEEHEIRVVTRREEGGRVRVEVRDTGQGIPAELREKIFEPFFTTRPVGVGTGLGLAICRRLVREMGGELEVESEVGKGTTFHVSLPVAEGEEAAVKAKVEVEAEAVREGRGRSVLVVDDERVVGRALQRLLGRRHEVEVLSDAREALARLVEGQRYDVIFCDLMMPEMSGPHFYEELTRRVPELVGRVVFMTGGAFSEEARRFLETARRPCLEKPFDMQRLHALLEALPG